MAKKTEEKKPPKRTRFGSVDQLPSGQWRARYSHRGKRYVARTTWAEKEHAEGWITDEARLIELGIWTDPDQRAAKDTALDTTIDEAVDHWIKTVGHLAESSRNLYQSIRRNRVTPYLADTSLAEFTRHRAYQWVSDIRRDHGGKTKRNADAYKLVHAVLQEEVNRGILDANPCQVEKATQVPKTGEKAVPTLQQLQVIVSDMPDHLKAGTQVAAWCGLRPAEWQELRRKDVERHAQPPVNGEPQPDRVVLNVRRQAHKEAGKWIVTPPKGGKTRRVVLPAHLVAVLDDQVRDYSGKGREGLLFPNINGDQLTRQKYYEAFKIRAKAAGCEKASPHSLRHFAGTAYAQIGASVRETMDYLGHSSPTVAMMYQHTAQGRPDFLAAAMSALAAQTTPTTTTSNEKDTDNA